MLQRLQLLNDDVGDAHPALGVSLKSAIQRGVSSKSCWHMARTPVTQQALNNTWLAAQGLLSVKNLWRRPGLHAAQNFVAQASLLNTLQAAPARDAPTLRQSQTVLRTV